MYNSNVYQASFGNFVQNTSAAVKATPFIRGGLDPDGSAEAWLMASGMNFTYKESPIMYSDEEGKSHVYDKTKVIYRSDNKNPITHVSDKFVPTQPKQVVDLYQRICKSNDFKMDKLGTIKGGKAIWGLAETNLHGATMGQDVQKAYLLLHTPNDGTGSFMIKLINKSLACDNMLTATLAGAHDLDVLPYLYKIRHSTEPDFEKIGTELEKLPEYYKTFLSQIDRLANTPVNTEDTVRYFVSLYAEQYEDLSSASKKHIDRLMNVNISGPGQNLRARQGTLYGALSAVTHYIDHKVTSRSSHLATAKENRFAKANFGDGESFKNKAFTKALELAVA